LGIKLLVPAIASILILGSIGLSQQSYAGDTPPNTTIISVIDGFGEVVSNGGSSCADIFTVTFEATDDVGVSSVECLIDGQPFPCNSPASFGLSDLGLQFSIFHFIEIRALDTSGNEDPTPSMFEFTSILECPSAVGGELIPLDTTSLLVTGAQMNAAWMIPVIVSAIGIGIVIARKF